MYFCTDCLLPACLDDAVTVFRDGTCICLSCHHRASALPPVPEAMRRTVEALLAEIEAA